MQPYPGRIDAGVTFERRGRAVVLHAQKKSGQRPSFGFTRQDDFSQKQAEIQYAYA